MSKVKFNKITLSGNEDKRLQTLDYKKMQTKYPREY